MENGTWWGFWLWLFGLWDIIQFLNNGSSHSSSKFETKVLSTPPNIQNTLIVLVPLRSQTASMAFCDAHTFHAVWWIESAGLLPRCISNSHSSVHIILSRAARETVTHKGHIWYLNCKDGPDHLKIRLAKKM